jgi:alkylhydroperoxidase family enzyme
MARVALLDPDKATGRAKDVFDRVKGYYRMVPGLQKGLAYLPETTDALWTLSQATVREGSIREELKRVFFAVTACEVECQYCTAAHMIALRGKHWSTDECVEIVDGQRPAAVTDAMVDELRAVGWTDAEIVEIVASVALMRYTSTVAVALDVPLEKAMEDLVMNRGARLAPGASSTQ